MVKGVAAKRHPRIESALKIRPLLKSRGPYLGSGTSAQPTTGSFGFGTIAHKTENRGGPKEAYQILGIDPGTIKPKTDDTAHFGQRSRFI